jgi:hypothetical protein
MTHPQVCCAIRIVPSAARAGVVRTGLRAALSRVCLATASSACMARFTRIDKFQGGSMKFRMTFAALAFSFAGSAFAFHCPAEMKKIDDAMANNPKLTAAQVDEVKKYRAEGEALHKAGKHQESLDTLAKAEKILGIQ